MQTYQQTVIICNKLGLHARAATKLAQLSNKFNAEVTVELDDKLANANSIMALMLLAGGQGKSVKVTAKGESAELALREICQLISDKFDEEE